VSGTGKDDVVLFPLPEETILFLRKKTKGSTYVKGKHKTDCTDRASESGCRSCIRNICFRGCWEVSYGLPTCGEERYTISGDGLFDFDKATIRPDLAAKLDKIVAESPELKSKGYTKVDIVGHTDSVGSDAYNQSLSERRAESTADYLASKGIPRNVITTSGMGESQPVATNETAEGRQLNRRVEITID